MAWADKRGDPANPHVCVGITSPVDVSKGPMWMRDNFGAANSPIVSAKGQWFVGQGGAPQANFIMFGKLGDTDSITEGSGNFEVEGLLGSPALVGNTIVCGNENGFGLAWDCVSSSFKWKNKFCGACAQEPGWSVAASASLAVFPGVDSEPMDRSSGVLPPSDHVYALNMKNGTTMWKFKPANPLMNMHAQIAENSDVLFNDSYGSLYCISVDGKVRWQVEAARAGASRTFGGITLVECTIFQTLNLKNKVAKNAPQGGKGAIRAYDLKTGSQKWEYLCDMEANAMPGVVAAGPDKKQFVIAGLGNNCGSPTFPGGDFWTGKVIALDAQDGSIQWTFEADPISGGRVSAGCSLTAPFRISAWSPPSCSADGTIYIAWHGGTLFALDGASGNKLSSFDTLYGIQGAPALHPHRGGTLIVSSLAKVMFFCNDIKACKLKTLKDLPQSFSITGTKAFAPCRCAAFETANPYLREFEAPSDLTKPTWCYRWKNDDLLEGQHFINIGGAAIDAQRNIYFGATEMPTNGKAYVACLQPDGTLRAELELGCGIQVPNTAILEKAFFFQNNCHLFCYDIETFEVNWISPFGNSKSGSQLTVGPDTVYVLRQELVGLVDAQMDNAVYAVNASDGTLKWKSIIGPAAMLYNNFIHLIGDGLLAVHAADGAWCACSVADGSIAEEWHPPDNKPITEVWEVPPMFSTGGGTGDGKGNYYTGFNLPQVQRGDFIYVSGVVRGFKVSGAVLKWEVIVELEITQVPVLVPREVIGSSEGDIVVAPCGWQIEWQSPNSMGKFIRDGGSVPGYLLGLDSETGKERWKCVMPPATSGYPVGTHEGRMIWPPDAYGGLVMDKKGTIFVYWQAGYLLAVNGGTGDIISQYETGFVCQAPPAIAPGMLVVAAGDRIIVWRDPELEEKWISENSGDPRAFKVALRGEGVAEGDILPDTPPEKLTWDEEAKKMMAQRKLVAKDLNKMGGEGATWLVIGGADKGGILVRRGEGLKTAELGRLGTGAKVKEMEKIGDRLHYQKLSGDGPDYGWISFSVKGAPMVQLEG